VISKLLVWAGAVALSVGVAVAPATGESRDACSAPDCAPMPGMIDRVVGSVPEPQSAGPATPPVRLGGPGDGIVGGVGVDGHGNPGSVVGHTSDGRSPGPGALEPNGSVETDALPGAPAPIDPVTPDRRGADPGPGTPEGNETEALVPAPSLAAMLSLTPAVPALAPPAAVSPAEAASIGPTPAARQVAMPLATASDSAAREQVAQRAANVARARSSQVEPPGRFFGLFGIFPALTGASVGRLLGAACAALGLGVLITIVGALSRHAAVT